MYICIAGKNKIAVECTKFVLEKHPELVLVTIPSKSDDGKDGWQPSLLKFSIDNGIDVIDLRSSYVLRDLIFISIQFDQILKVDNFSTDQLYNLHFSLLPEYKGVYTSVWPILNGEKKSGVTLHLIDDGIDTGPIVAQKEFSLTIEDTSRDLYLKYMENGYSLFTREFDNILKKNIKLSRQPFEGSTYYSKKSIQYGSIEIDLDCTAYQIHNQIRAFCFAEYQYPELFGCQIFQSRLTDERSLLKPGTVVEDTFEFFKIATVDYNIITYKVKS